MAKGKNRKVTLELVYQRENIEKAVKSSKRNKHNSYGVRKFDKDLEANIRKIEHELKTQTYVSSPPKFEKSRGAGKKRVLAKVKHYDNVIDHALMQVIGDVLIKSYFYESAASIPGRGIDYTMNHIRKYIDKHKGQTIYWSTLDFVKFYHYIVRQKIYDRLCMTFTNSGIRWLLHEIIWYLGEHNGLFPDDGTRGVGLGRYPIQPLVNFYLNDMDRDIARVKGCKNFRYCDNVLIMGTSIESVWEGNRVALGYADVYLEQEMHKNISVQVLTEDNPIIFVGRKFFKDHTLIINKTKYNFKRKAKQEDEAKRRKSLASYKGILMHIDGLHLWQKVTGMKKFSDFSINQNETIVNGKEYVDVPVVQASFLKDRKLIVKRIIENCTTKHGDGRMFIVVEENGHECKFCTNNERLKNTMSKVKEMDGFPFEATLRCSNIQGNKINIYFE